MSMETPQERSLHDELISRAWTDPVFREALKANPREAIARALGATIPPGVEIEVVEETPTRLYLVLPVPPLPGEAGELSEGDLGAVAGGLAIPEERARGGGPTAPIHRTWNAMTITRPQSPFRTSG